MGQYGNIKKIMIKPEVHHAGSKTGNSLGVYVSFSSPCEASIAILVTIIYIDFLFLRRTSSEAGRTIEKIKKHWKIKLFPYWLIFRFVCLCVLLTRHWINSNWRIRCCAHSMVLQSTSYILYYLANDRMRDAPFGWLVGLVHVCIYGSRKWLTDSCWLVYDYQVIEAGRCERIWFNYEKMKQSNRYCKAYLNGQHCAKRECPYQHEKAKEYTFYKDQRYYINYKEIAMKIVSSKLSFFNSFLGTVKPILPDVMQTLKSVKLSLRVAVPNTLKANTDSSKPSALVINVNTCTNFDS